MHEVIIHFFRHMSSFVYKKKNSHLTENEHEVEIRMSIFRGQITYFTLVFDEMIYIFET